MEEIKDFILLKWNFDENPNAQDLTEAIGMGYVYYRYVFWDCDSALMGVKKKESDEDMLNAYKNRESYTEKYYNIYTKEDNNE